jgi:hypothetical protein
LLIGSLMSLQEKYETYIEKNYYPPTPQVASMWIKAIQIKLFIKKQKQQSEYFEQIRLPLEKIQGEISDFSWELQVKRVGMNTMKPIRIESQVFYQMRKLILSHPGSNNRFLNCNSISIKTKYAIEKNDKNSRCLVNRDYKVHIEDVEMHTYQYFWEVLRMYKIFDRSDSNHLLKFYKSQLTS